MKFYQDLNVQCPFYRQEKAGAIMCEGVEDGVGLTMGYDTPKHKKEYKQDYCTCEDWRSCRVAKMLHDKYYRQIG